ncbi:MAG: asparagine synthase (glutamine-hydrolyzing) [Flavobacteriales bacterium]|nr:asparagine synthase (glutamine-hydrolyzing) [Flavobacteriales bacterium]
MCGISGIIGNNTNVEFLINKMLKIQHHRGPDYSNYWLEDNVCLGHNRLAIIDLNESSNQPMFSNDGRYGVVFNGEIYNYKELKSNLKEYNFKTNSDTEVLIAMFIKYGKDMLSYLNGMFSFVIFDKKENKLFCARDRFGVKPFYYSLQNGVLYFASEIKAIWEVGVKKEKNDKVWSSYLVYGSYGLPHETFWNNIYQLSAGHYFEYDLNKKEIQPVLWYDFIQNIKNTPQLEEKELKEKYLELLIDSIKLRFRADVPVGFNISGGLDSSTLLALVNKIFPNNHSIEAFTFYSNDDKYDELPWVEQMISKTDNPLNKCLLEVDKVEDLINHVSVYQDEPFGGFPTIAYSNIFKEAREKGIIVLLDGQGMDESWAGYDYYQTNTGFTVQGTKTSPVRPEVLTSEFKVLAEKVKYPEPFDNKLQNLQYRDLFYTKIPRALRFNDRISMMYSTELREPFLDYRLVELAFAQKEEIKIKEGKSKWMLRELVKDLLDDTIALAPKRPLQTPQREWIANQLKEFISCKIENFSNNDFIDKKEILKIWKEYQEGNQDNSFYLWQWINLNEIV